jgi:hypothetical protein
VFKTDSLNESLQALSHTGLAFKCRGHTSRGKRSEGTDLLDVCPLYVKARSLIFESGCALV